MSSKLIKRGPVPALDLEDPTGAPSWPLVLMAGVEGSGKSYNAAAFSASDLIGRTFYIPIGETGIDEYGAIPGVRFQKMRHDGTFMGIARQAWAATAQPRTDGKPNVIVIDSATELWDLLQAEQQEVVNAKAAQRGKGKPGEDAEMGFDSWNAAKKRWNALLDLLREHDGPVVFTSRLEEVADAPAILAGNKNAPKVWKPRVEKNFPYAVDALFQARSPRVWICTKVRSLTITVQPGEELAMPDNFSLDWFMRKLGLDKVEASPRAFVSPDSAAYLDEHAAEVAEEYAAANTRQQQANAEQTKQAGGQQARLTDEQWLAAIAEAKDVETCGALWRRGNAAGQLLNDIDGLDLGDRIKARVEQIKTGKVDLPVPTAEEAQQQSEEAHARTLQAVSDGAGESTSGEEAEATLAAAEQAADGPEAQAPKEQPTSRSRTATIAALTALFAGDAEAMEAACVEEFGKGSAFVVTKDLSAWRAREAQANEEVA